MDRWKGRVAVVTGASAGIGAAVCKLLANEGMKVVGCARRLEKVWELAKENANIYPIKVLISDDKVIPLMQLITII
jgi:NADP+-dependent farnesol dehydrogenase